MIVVSWSFPVAALRHAQQPATCCNPCEAALLLPQFELPLNPSHLPHYEHSPRQLAIAAGQKTHKVWLYGNAS
jgi:hypothetical protein